MITPRILAAATLVLLLGGVAAAQETFENLQFTSWAKHKKGTSITLKETTMSGGVMASESFTTTTLLDVRADGLTLEMTLTGKVDGMEIKSPPIKIEVKKTLPLLPGLKKEDFNKLPKGTKIEEVTRAESGTETLKVNGTEYPAKWYKTYETFTGSKRVINMWTSDDVPGTLVKAEQTTTPTKDGPTVKITMELIEFKTP